MTPSASTSHIRLILRLSPVPISRSDRQTSASGWMPMLRSAATECCVGLVFSSPDGAMRSEEHTSELQSRQYLVCRLLLEKKKHYTHQVCANLHRYGSHPVATTLPPPYAVSPVYRLLTRAYTPSTAQDTKHTRPHPTRTTI